MASVQNLWSTSKFKVDGSCFLYACCSCIQCCKWPQARTNYDGSNCMFNCCCAAPCLVFNIVREGYGIEGNWIGDLCYTCWCPCFALPLIEREIMNPNRAMLKQALKASGQTWTNGVCKCKFGGPCFMAYCCNPCALGTTRTKYDGSNCFFNCLCLSAPLLYNIIREGYGIDGTCVQDCLIGGILPCCATHRCQLEIEARGPKPKNIVVVQPGMVADPAKPAV